MQNKYTADKVRKKHISFYTILLVIILTAWIGVERKKWNDRKVLITDAKIYYSYLPAAFIYHDLTFGFSEDLQNIFGRTWTNRAPNGNKVVKMTMGNAVCWLPFFGIAHLYASLTQYDNNGYSVPYHFMIFISAICYLLLGLVFLRKLLIRYYDHITTSVVLIITVFATNLIYYVADEPGMSHINSFSLITVFFYLTIRWFEKRTIQRSVITGVLLGLITLIRPVNAMIVIIPVTFWLFNYKTINEKIIFLKKNTLHILLILVTAFLAFLPQMIYWKMITGDLFYYTYRDESFFFLDPNITNGLFSYRKGWLVYTPVMILSILGLFFMNKKDSILRWPVLIMLVVFVYITYSWWCWWYGGGYGSRPMIDIYGILAVPLAALIGYILNKNIWLKIMLSLILGFLVYYNHFQIKQYRITLLHWDGMTKEAYRKIFLKKKFPSNYDKIIKRPDTDKAIRGEEEY